MKSRIAINGTALDVGAGNCYCDGKNWSPGLSFEGKIVRADIIQKPGIDVEMDADKNWPLKNASFDVVYAAHVIEHVKNPFHFVKEAHRVLKPKGILYIRRPHLSNPVLYGIVDHLRGGTTTTFNTFDADVQEALFEKDVQFKTIEIDYGIRLGKVMRPIIDLIGFVNYEYFLANKFIPIDEIRYVMQKITVENK